MLALLISTLAIVPFVISAPETCDKGKAVRYLKSFYSVYPVLESLNVQANQDFIVGCRVSPQRSYVLLNPGSYSLKVVSVVRDTRDALLKVEDESFEMPNVTIDWCKMTIIDAVYLLFPDDFIGKDLRMNDKEISLNFTVNTRAKKVGTCVAVMREKGGSTVYEVTVDVNIASKCMNIGLSYEQSKGVADK